MRAKVDELKWIRCGKCYHKLGKFVLPKINGKLSIVITPIEIKCSSCKTLNVLEYDSFKREVAGNDK